MSDTMIGQRLQTKRHVGFLERRGMTWRIPIIENASWIGPADDLYVGDRLHFNGIATRREYLLLRLVFKHGAWFGEETLQRQYQLVAMVWCPACETTGFPSVSINHSGTPGALTWTFTRTCQECTYRWEQDGQAINPYD